MRRSSDLRELAREPHDDAVALDALHPLPPVQPLGQFLCAGANYRKHLTEIVFTMARNDPQETRPDEVLRQEAAEFVHHRAESGMPFVFVAPSSSVSGARDDVVLWGPAPSTTGSSSWRSSSDATPTACRARTPWSTSRATRSATTSARAT